MKITAIYGPNGSGKTQYVERLRRQMASDRVRYVAFRDSYGVSTDQAYYLQLRWNQHDIDPETPNVGELFEKAYHETGDDTAERRQWQQHLYRLFQLEPLLDKYIITLSSGELRKFQLARTLLARPRTLIIDNPFIGLDAETREQLRDLLPRLSGEADSSLFTLHSSLEHIYLVVSRRKDIPDYVTDIVDMTPEATDDQVVIAFHDVTIRYGERTILKNLDWTVRQGAGKSTLLSLVCSDNPQRYACDITLFGHQLGDGGVSIWDLKRRIGYVSPEMHRSYHRSLPALHVVASGLKDTVGLYVRPTDAERQQCLWWMRLFGIDHLADRSFLQLSSGEQRLKAVIEMFCRRPEKTLIYVSHYREEWPPCIDHELFLKRQ